MAKHKMRILEEHFNLRDYTYLDTYLGFKDISLHPIIEMFVGRVSGSAIEFAKNWIRETQKEQVYVKQWRNHHLILVNKGYHIMYLYKTHYVNSWRPKGDPVVFSEILKDINKCAVLIDKDLDI